MNSNFLMLVTQQHEWRCEKKELILLRFLRFYSKRFRGLSIEISFLNASIAIDWELSSSNVWTCINRIRNRTCLYGPWVPLIKISGVWNAEDGWWKGDNALLFSVHYQFCMKRINPTWKLWQIPTLMTEPMIDRLDIECRMERICESRTTITTRAFVSWTFTFLIQSEHIQHSSAKFHFLPRLPYNIAQKTFATSQDVQLLEVKTCVDNAVFRHSSPSLFLQQVSRCSWKFSEPRSSWFFFFFFN